ncbi:MAG: bifunctional adenosylcobinamide kinase/adenosylcobinamide-phosphate guanylyltransferase [Clostridia bacterium]|nr:bifunctional adenosylcobinamide kinase/adenosylcobinamide-phosphate guanylyltransferase [Clostridia bacterium]
MMKLYIGGAWQGQADLARRENPGTVIVEDVHEAVRQALGEGMDPVLFAKSLCQAHPQGVFTANEVGSGVVPMTAEDRAFREGAGRALCYIAQQADAVVRVICGIGVRIK